MQKIQNISGFLDFIYGKFDFLKDNEINLIYEGLITHQITKTFAALTEETLSKEMESDVVQKRVFHVLVECLQNISKHADEQSALDKIIAKRGIFLISKGTSQYTIVTGNIIETARVPEFTSKLEYLNTLDKPGLNKYYKEQLLNDGLSDKGGAGLGLIDIIRKSGEKLKYYFVEASDTNSFFILVSSVQRLN
jgi:hypothetical protein